MRDKDMTETDRLVIEAFDRARRARTAKQERDLAVQHELAVLDVKAEFGCRIRELEAENKALRIYSNISYAIWGGSILPVGRPIYPLRSFF